MSKLRTLLALIGVVTPPSEPVRPGFTVDIYDDPPLSEPTRREASWDRNKRREKDEVRKRKKKARQQRKKSRG